TQGRVALCMRAFGGAQTPVPGKMKKMASIVHERFVRAARCVVEYSTPPRRFPMRARFLVLPLAMTLASGVAMMPLMHPAQAAIDISINIAPPPLPVYEQPPLPGPGYMWSPGYWAYDPADGYYWVPGTWVEPPEVGLLWTPGYWAFVGGAYAWNAGYWGPTVGFYGGVDYGFGYTGRGFYGGRWDHGHFAYNRAAWNVGNAHVT